MRRFLFCAYLLQRAPSLLAQTTTAVAATSTAPSSLSSAIASTTTPTSTAIAASTTVVATPTSSTTTSSSFSSSSSSSSSSSPSSSSLITSSALVTPSSISSSSSSTSSTGPQTLTVQAGANGFNFSPNVTYANPGDTIVFDFYPTNHSVIRGEYAGNTKVCGSAGCNPCVPWELYHEGEPNQGFFSSNELVSSYNLRKQWTLQINDTEPIFFYCDALTSCHPEGMVGVINPASNQSIETQHQKAVTAEYQLAPGQSWPAEGGKSSSSSSNSSSTSSSSHKSHLSGGSIAGIVIGVVAFVCVAGALVFYVARTRTYDKVFRQSQVGGSEAGGGVGNAGDGAGASLAWYKSPSLRVASPPPGELNSNSNSNNGALSPPLASEKSPNSYRWSDITAMSGAAGGHQRHSTAPPIEGGGTFVGYNRHTGAPEFAPELPGDSEIQQLPGGSTPHMGSTRSPAEMEATDAAPAPMSPGSRRSSSAVIEPASPTAASTTRRGSSQSSPGKKHFGFPGRTY
ncbi:uncharacterized protein J3D65DRAFT_17290 [Phyllosticta citribraziliensis]|uniref:Extracellular serine-rich protein n=1 Tax=Phyllosticta citribraziliensis TaxID=989973 RepID=A0ABR1MAQ1_9PEZI